MNFFDAPSINSFIYLLTCLLTYTAGSTLGACRTYTLALRRFTALSDISLFTAYEQAGEEKEEEKKTLFANQ